ncbi:hypothetical protein K9B35_19980 [Sphingomonas sp. R647]|uniref:hypothetical protein n=1 Tax=Sphingomonas sp. R647 TaxID=2875233 RepID=UPI001CD26C29|nr:hypothetical protein [Sphingomonas sp. R647]MCA1200253.1 hypothetical protein [Sphingomonas sp. R647]
MIFATIALFTVGLSDDPSKPDAQQRVCKMHKQTGTRFSKTTCRTRAEWDAIAEAARRTAEESFNKPVISIEKGS